MQPTRLALSTSTPDEAPVAVLTAGWSPDELRAMVAQEVELRSIIVDYYRSKSRTKRDAPTVSYDELVIDQSHLKPESLLQIDEALTRLEGENPRAAAVFEHRFFAGYTSAETAEYLGIALRTTERLWQISRRTIAEHL